MLTGLAEQLLKMQVGTGYNLNKKYYSYRASRAQLLNIESYKKYFDFTAGRIYLQN